LRILTAARRHGEIRVLNAAGELEQAIAFDDRQRGSASDVLRGRTALVSSGLQITASY
jgi:hypothetical protein